MGKMNWKEFGRKHLWPNFKALIWHLCRGTEEKLKKFQDAQFPSRDLNPGYPDMKQEC
jgi:hypothetical protein